MEIGTKIQMNNGQLGIEQGLIVGSEYDLSILWDTEEEDGTEEFCYSSFEQFDGKILSQDWEFKYINDDGTRK